MLRELDGALPLMAQMEPRVAGELAEGLERLGVKELKTLCKERCFKGYTGLTKAALIQRLRGGAVPPLMRSQQPRQWSSPLAWPRSRPAWIAWRPCCNGSLNGWG